MGVVIVQPYKIYEHTQKNVNKIIYIPCLIINVLKKMSHKTIYSVICFRSEQIEGHEFRIFV